MAITTNDEATTPATTASPWLTPREAAARAKCGLGSIYAAVRGGKLRAVKLGDRNNIRIHEAWLDAWMLAATILNPDAPGGDVAVGPLPFRGRATK